MMHNFPESLKASHAAQDLPFWAEVYRQHFPDIVAMTNHRQDGPHQRAGVDRSILLSNSKLFLVDEKVRWRNKKTGKVYDDIALEFYSDLYREVPGWVCKPLLADYIAYAIAPLGRCYLLPVVQLQTVWKAHGPRWIGEATRGERNRRYIDAENADGRREWTTRSVNVTPGELFPLLGQCFRSQFTPIESPYDVPDEAPPPDDEIPPPDYDFPPNVWGKP